MFSAATTWRSKYPSITPKIFHELFTQKQYESFTGEHCLHEEPPLICIHTFDLARSPRTCDRAPWIQKSPPPPGASSCTLRFPRRQFQDPSHEISARAKLGLRVTRGKVVDLSQGVTEVVDVWGCRRMPPSQRRTTISRRYVANPYTLGCGVSLVPRLAPLHPYLETCVRFGGAGCRSLDPSSGGLRRLERIF